jgi:hypothetical protein
MEVAIGPAKSADPQKDRARAPWQMSFGENGAQGRN